MRGAAPVDADRARDPARPGAVRRAAARRGRAGLCPGAAGDLSRRRRPHRRGAVGHQPRRRLERFPRRRSKNFVGAAAEHRLCRHRRHDRLYRAGPHPDPQERRRLAAGARLDRRIRLDRVCPVRRAAAGRATRQRAISSAPTTRSCPTATPISSARDWDMPNRAERIEELLAATPRQSPAASAAIQADTLSLMAQQLVPLMTRDRARRRRRRARRSSGCRPGISAWTRTRSSRCCSPPGCATLLTRVLVRDSSATPPADYWDLRPRVIEAVLTEHPDWCGDRRGRETAAATRCWPARSTTRWPSCAAPTAPTWRNGTGAAPMSPSSPTRCSSRIPVLRDWLRVAIPTDGGYRHGQPRPDDDPRRRAAVRAASSAPGCASSPIWPTPAGSRMIAVPGQSGNPLSPHFADLLQRWRDFD